MITEEAFERLKKGSASIKAAAAMQVKLAYFQEQTETTTNDVRLLPCTGVLCSGTLPQTSHTLSLRADHHQVPRPAE